MQNILVAQFQKLFTYFGDNEKEEVLRFVIKNPSLLGIDGLSM
jgi:hypothetical protein